MKRRKIFSYSLLFITGYITSCNSNNQTSNKLITAPKNLRFTVTDANSLQNLKQNFESFRVALEKVIETNIEFFPVENPTAAASALLLGKVDIVFAGPSEYLILNTRAKAIPIIAIQRPNYHSIIVVRADSKVKSLAQLKGKTIAMRKIGSTSGHIAPTKLLIDAGLDPNIDVKIVILDDQGIQALKKGEVDAWATASDRYKNILESKNLSEKDFSVISKGPLLPNDVFVASNQLAPSFIEEMRSRMLAHQDKLIQSILVAKANQQYQGGTLVPANDADYNMIREVYQTIGQGSFL
jgi:phosphonate transport system substrate-binding protein